MRETDLIPVNNRPETFEKINNELKKKLMVNSIDQFITMYNMKILDNRNMVVSDLSKLLLNSFRNLTLLNNKFFIESPAETALKTIKYLLKDWETVISIKRIALLLMEDEYPLDTKIVFTEEKQGRPMIELNTPEGIILENYWASERIVNKNADLANNMFTANLLKTYNGNENECYFDLADLVDLNDSFFLDIQEIILKNSFVDKVE